MLKAGNYVKVQQSAGHILDTQDIFVLFPPFLYFLRNLLSQATELNVD